MQTSWAVSKQSIHPETKPVDDLWLYHWPGTSGSFREEKQWKDRGGKEKRMIFISCIFLISSSFFCLDIKLFQINFWCFEGIALSTQNTLHLFIYVWQKKSKKGHISFVGKATTPTFMTVIDYYEYELVNHFPMTLFSVPESHSPYTRSNRLFSLFLQHTTYTASLAFWLPRFGMSSTVKWPFFFGSSWPYNSVQASSCSLVMGDSSSSDSDVLLSSCWSPFAWLPNAWRSPGAH